MVHAHKYTKSKVSFEHPAKGKQHCSECKHFQVIAPLRCEIVEGKILPQDWCKKFVDVNDKHNRHVFSRLASKKEK